MISTALPNIASYKNEPSKLGANTIIFANTTDKYYYPEHKTPYLFATNFLNKGNYVLNRKYIDISDKQFYFLDVNDDLEIKFSEAVPRQTLFILFEETFINDCVNYIQTSDNELLDLPNCHPDAGFRLPNVPYPININILKIISLLTKNKLGKEDFECVLVELITEFALLNTSTLKHLKKIKAVKKSTQEELYRRLFLARELMNENVFQKITIGQIAQEVCLNKFHFLSNFKNLFETTPYQYFIELKLQKAFYLLQRKKHSVTEVCYILGFESIGSFSNQFKKRFLVSPSEV